MSKIIAVGNYYKKEKGTNIYKITEFVRHFKTSELMVIFIRVNRSGRIVKDKVFTLSLDDFARSELEQYDLVLKN